MDTRANSDRQAASYSGNSGFISIIAIITLIISVVTAIWTKDRAIKKVHKDSVEFINTYRNYLLDKVRGYTSYPKILSHRPQVIKYLKQHGNQDEMNEYLVQFNEDIGLAITYLLNDKGIVVASSNYKDSSSFVGKDFSFREYFVNALKGTPSEQISFGILTKIPGYFRSHPVMDAGKIVGVAVIKYDIRADMNKITPEGTGKEEILIVADDSEVIFHASDNRYLFHTIHALPEDALEKLKKTKKYADQSLLPLSIIRESIKKDMRFITIRQQQSSKKYTDTDYLMAGRFDKNIGWHVHLLVDLSGIKYEIYKNIVYVLLLMILVYAIGTFAMYKIRKGQELSNYRDHLEELVQVRTAELTNTNAQLQDEANKRKALLSELEKAYDELKLSQKHLIQSEKMASLGALVAGVAHEINTPIGIGITGASHFVEITKSISNSFGDGTITRSQLGGYISDAYDIGKLILSNLIRTGELVKGFKLVAADQASEEKRVFKLKPYLQDIISSLTPKLKKTPHRIVINCDDDIVLDTYPGAVAQVITNLLMNSLIHAFDHNQQGAVAVDVERRDDFVVITYKDNGKGISQSHIKKIFDPFFTTNRGGGGTGLGLNICYNVVTQTLKGSISCESVEGQGTTFIISLPVKMESAA